MQPKMKKKVWGVIGCFILSFFCTGLLGIKYSPGAEGSEPHIAFMDPNHGDSNGKESVIITGSGLADAIVLFGGREADVGYSDSNRIELTSPPGLGVVDVSVIHPDGKRDSSQYSYILEEKLYLDDQPTGLEGQIVQFSLGINYAPNEVSAFGLEIRFDPDELEPVLIPDPNDPYAYSVLFTRGDLVEDFAYFDVGYNPGSDYIIVGGFTDQNSIAQNEKGLIATFHFKILKAFGETDLDIIKNALVDDIAGWTVRTGSLYPCPPEVCDGVDNDCDGDVDEDCDEYYFDGDGDTFGDTNTKIWTMPDAEPAGFVTSDGDCDDTDPLVYPDAEEICDGKDNDCDGDLDAGEVDMDMDFVMICAGDCDDSDPSVYPGAYEICDGKDNDCDGEIGLDEVDADKDTFMVCEGDCDDGDSSVYPGAEEICDGKDNDCDGEIGSDEVDADKDTFMICEGDCDDGDSSVYPGAEEQCDGIDNDCNGETDEGCDTYYFDGDKDGFGDPNISVISVSPPMDYVIYSMSFDCDDTDPYVNPNAMEQCDGKDNDCNGETDEGCDTYYFDGDKDGFGDPDSGIEVIDPNELEGDYVTDHTDCDDADPRVHPGAEEVCDGIDNDCDGQTDKGDDLKGCVEYYFDYDHDGYGMAGDFRCLCEPEESYTAVKPGDCDDADPNINPGVPDPCGGEDLNCDGIVDCASLACLINDPDRPGENPMEAGLILDFYVSKPFKELIDNIDDPDMLVFDPNRNAYGFHAEGLNPGIYELNVSNADSDPNQWQYRPLKKALTLKAGANRKGIDLVRIPEGAKPKDLRVEVHTIADDLFLTLKKLVLDPNQGIWKEKLIQTEELSKSDPNQSFQQDFILFEDANYRILAQAKGYRGVKQDLYVDQDTNVALTIDQPALPSLSVTKSDIDDGMIALTFSYRDATGVQGEWTDANHSSIMQLDVTFFDPNDDVNGDKRPDDPNLSAGGLHVTHTDMEKVPDPGDPSRITRLRYPVDGLSHYMTLVKGETAGDPNSYVIAFLMELSDPNSRHLLGPVLRVFKVPEVLPPVGERPIAEVVDTLLGAEILSMGAIPIEGKLQLDGQTKPIEASFEASAIDPAFLIYVDDSGEAEGSADPAEPLELRIEYVPDPVDEDVTVVRIEIRDAGGNPVEYNPPVRDPDAPAIILEIPLIGSLQPPTSFSEAVQKAVIKFSRFGRVEIFEPSDGEDIEFYISEAGLYMARVTTKHTSEWYTVSPIAVPLNFSVTTEGMGPGEVNISWAPNPENTLDLEKYQIYYSQSPDVTADPSNASKDIPAGESSVTIDNLSDQAIYYFILVAVDSSGAMSPQTDVKYAIPGVGYATETLHSGIDLEDYRIITFPVFPDDPDPSSPENLLDDLDETAYKTAWRLYWWDPDDPSENFENTEFPKIGNIMPSKAFFLITKEKDIVIDIPGRPVQASYSYEIHNGWNLIGSPYPFDISWQDILDDPNNATIRGQLYGGDPNDANNDDYEMPKLYAFDPESSDSYYRYETDVMEAGVGYWVKNKGEDASLHFEPKAYFSELSRLYRPVGSSSELPPGLPGAAGQDISGARGSGCFVSTIDAKEGNSGTIFFFLLIMGFVAFAVFIGISLVGRPKDGMRRFAIGFFLLSLGLSVSLFANHAAAVGEVTTYIEARNAFRAGDYEKAEEGFNRVLAVYPKHAYAQKDLGLTLIFLKRPNEAMDALKKAMTLSPDTRIALEARQAAVFILGKMRSPLDQSFTMGYIYDDNVTLYPEDEQYATGRWASIGHIRYRPQLSYHIPGMKGLNSFSLGYMYDYRFYDRIEERDLEIHLFMGTWRYSAGHFRLTFLANYHSSHLHYDRYTTGPGIGVRWAYDLTYRMMFELGGGYDWQTRVPDRSKDKEIIKGSASLRFYSPTRRGYLELDYQLRDDKEKELTDLVKKEELTSGTTHQYTMSFVIPKSFILPFGYITYQGNWSSHMDKHTVIYSVKEFEWYRFQDLGGKHREDKTFTYEFRHIQNLYKKRIDQKRRIAVDMELKYTYRSNDSDIDEINPGLEGRDYHKNVFAVGLTCKF